MTVSEFLNDPEYMAAAEERMKQECRAQGLSDYVTDPTEIAWLSALVNAAPMLSSKQD